MRVALYLRVSTEEQAAHGYSLAHQRAACEARARALGASAIRCFADEGVSGAILERPALTALRQAIRRGQIDAVVALDPDRLARSLVHQLLLTEEWERQRVRLEFVNFEWRRSPEGRLFYSLRGAIAEYEKEKIRDRTTMGRVQKARLGKMPVANAPFGYRYQREGGQLVVIPEEAAVVRQIFDAWVREGLSLSAIARRLSAAGLPTRTGRDRWHRQTIRQLLANPAYAGTFYSRRFDCSGVALNRHRPPEARQRPRPRPPEEWIAVPVPAIVPRETWQAAQARLAAAGRLGRHPDSVYLLSGLARCGRCGAALTGARQSYWGRRRRTYRCRRPQAGCGRVLAAEPLEEAVWQQAVGWLHQPALWAQALARPPASPPDPLRLRRRLEGARSRLLLALERGWASPQELAPRLDRIAGQLAALDAKAAPPADPAPSPLWEGWASRLSPSQRRRVLQLLLETVVVEDATVVLVVRFDPHRPPSPEPSA